MTTISRDADGRHPPIHEDVSPIRQQDDALRHPASSMRRMVEFFPPLC
jgi:hypothetical protein